MGEDGTGIDQIEVVVLEREMGNDRGDGKVEGRLKVLLAPENVLGLYVHSVYIAALADIAEPSNQSAAAAAKVQDPLATSERMARRLQDSRHGREMLLPPVEELFGVLVAQEQMGRRNGQIAGRPGSIGAPFLDDQVRLLVPPIR